MIPTMQQTNNLILILLLNTSDILHFVCFLLHKNPSKACKPFHPSQFFLLLLLLLLTRAIVAPRLASDRIARLTLLRQLWEALVSHLPRCSRLPLLRWAHT